MIRCAFNGGELSPSTSARLDLDVFQRGAETIENFDLAQVGGLKRRRGFKKIATVSDSAVIIPYQYSTTDRYLIELDEDFVRIRTADGETIESLPSVWTEDQVKTITYKQVNALLFLLCETYPVTTLKYDGTSWTLSEFSFTNPPWRYDEELRDYKTTVVKSGDYYEVTWPEEETVELGDMLKVVVQVESQDSFTAGATIRSGAIAGSALSASSSVAKGKKIYIANGSYWQWWTCKKAFTGSTDFVSGMTSYADYPLFFEKGIVCHSSTLTCKGTWGFYCSGEWYGQYAVERRYKDEDEWTILGTSTSRLEGASNNLLTGSEKSEECYLRLMLFQTKLGSSSDVSSGFPADSCNNKLTVDSYKKTVVLKNIASTTTTTQSAGTIKQVYLSTTNSIWKTWYKKNTGVKYYIVNKSIGNYALSKSGSNYVTPALDQTEGKIVSGETLTLRPIVSAQTITPTSGQVYFFPNGGTITRGGTVEILAALANGTSRYKLTYNIIQKYNASSGSWENVALPDNAMTGGNQTIAASAGTYYRLNGTSTTIFTGPYADKISNPTTACSFALTASTTSSGATISFTVGSVTVQANYSRTGNWENVTPIPENTPTAMESNYWSFSAFRNQYGFPTICEMFQSRLIFSATTDQPQTIWASKSNDLNNFEVSTDSDSALAMTLATTTQNKIRWLMPHGSKILLGTADAEWVISGGNTSAVTVSNAQSDNYGYIGSAEVPALMATDKAVYFERGGGRVMQYGYDYESDAYISKDLTVFADHVLVDGGGVVKGAVVRKPEVKIVLVREDGQLALMTYNAIQQVNGWHRYKTNGQFQAVAVLPNGNKDDLLFVITQREDGRWLEVMAPENDYSDDGEDYESIMVTNALVAPETGMGIKGHDSRVMMYLGDTATAGNIQVSIDGDKWDIIDRAPSSTLEKGWHPLIGDSKWQYDRIVGIKVTGNAPFNLLAIQG